jgi:hypothetical protein
MRNKRDITIKVIQNNSINNKMLAKYFAENYEIEIRKMQSQKSQKKGWSKK